MKLYATITSERARKSQGGNEFINIVIRNAGQQPVMHITVSPDGTGEISMLDTMDITLDRVAWIGTDDDTKPRGGDKFSMFVRKGEKKKGECSPCITAINTGNCIHCGKYYNRA